MKKSEADATLRMFVRDRDRTITAAVMRDDWDAVKRFCKRWGTKVPEDERILKAGIYKAALACTKIPADVKKLAAEKCVELGFKPTIGD